VRRLLIVHTDPGVHPLSPSQLAALEALDAEVALVAESQWSRLPSLLERADAVLNADFRLPASLIARMRQCRVIARFGMGVDNIDVAAATAHGILVANVPAFGAEEVADRALLLLLAAACRLPQSDAGVRNGRWRSGAPALSAQVSGQMLGIVGLGRVGRAIARRAVGFGLQVAACDPFLAADAFAEQRVTGLALEQLLSTADFVCLSLPLVPTTRHLIDERRLALMKPSAILINVARGGLVDQPALTVALAAGRLAAAGLEVLEQEPPDPADPLLRLDNVVFTPHTAAHTQRALDGIREQAVNSVVQVLSGKRISNVVNPEVLNDSSNGVPNEISG